MIRVIDTETTGLPEEGGRVCEIGWTDIIKDSEGRFALGDTQAVLVVARLTCH